METLAKWTINVSQSSSGVCQETVVMVKAAQKKLAAGP